MPFIINPNFYHVLLNGTLHVDAPGYLDNDLSTSGTLTAPTLLDGPDHGTWTALVDGTFTYTPTAGFTGIDTVVVSVSNGFFQKTETVTIDVYASNDPRVVIIEPNFYNVAMNGVADVAAPGYLDNDFTTSGTLTTPTLLDAPDHGTWSALVNGKFTYTPNTGFTGVDTVLVSVSNGTVTKNETVTFNVYGPNDAPVVGGIPTDDFYIVGQAAVTLAAGATIADDDSANFASATVHIRGTTFAGDGNVLSATTTGTSITAAYNSASETLTLSGSDTAAHYQSVLESVKFSTTNADSRLLSVDWQVNDGFASNNLSTIVTNTVHVGAIDHDFNRDGRSDVLLFNNNGTIGEWQLNGTQITGGGNAGTIDPTWHIAGTGDFNHDARDDVLLINNNGTVGEWQLNGTQITGGGNIGTIDPTWHIAGTGDFNHDRNSDVLLINNNGTVGEWQLNGTQITGGGNIGTIDPTWHFAGTGDFNHDSNSDVLLINNNGTVGEWQLNGTQITGGGNIGTIDPTWHIAGTGDFNHDGNSDILLFNDNGTVGEWLLNGTQIIGGGNVGTLDPSWHIAKTGDYNGDGNDDILLSRNDGTVGEWLLNGTQIIGGGNVGTIDPTWHI